MKWFKHWNEASQGLSLRRLWDENEIEAYAIWWQLCELVSRWEEKDQQGNHSGKITLTWGVLSRETGWNRQRLVRVLGKIAETSLIELKTISETSFELFIPKWLKFQETRGQKFRQKKSNEPGDIRSKKREERRESKELEPRALSVAPPPAATPVIHQNPFSNLSLKASTRMAELYPDREFLEREKMKMEVWLDANPQKRPKSTSGWANFIMRWLSKGWEQYRKGIPSNQGGVKKQYVWDLPEENK